MSNEELIYRFEADPEDSFHHAHHVRLAFAYLCRYPVLQALEKFASALKRYAAAREKPDRYHETITHAYFFLIRERMARLPGADWEGFTRENPDLLEWKDGILSRYYHEATVKSDLAQRVRLPRPVAVIQGVPQLCLYLPSFNISGSQERGRR